MEADSLAIQDPGGTEPLAYSGQQWNSLDVAYIENWSLRMDLKIIARTIGVVFARTGS